MFKMEQDEEVSGILMRDMKPCEIGVLLDGGMYEGDTVMRTADVDDVEVMILNGAGPDRCWSGSGVGGNTLRVKILPPGTKITLITI